MELLKGAIVMTAQERPEGLAGGFREDLFKKMISADAVFGRLPYQILTKPLQLIGWKRMECNRLIRFRDVTWKTFDSIRRRCLIIRIRSKFVDPESPLLNDPEASATGLFPRQLDLKDFLGSGPGIAAGLRIQHGFEKVLTHFTCGECASSPMGFAACSVSSFRFHTRHTTVCFSVSAGVFSNVRDVLERHR